MSLFRSSPSMYFEEGLTTLRLKIFFQFLDYVKCYIETPCLVWRVYNETLEWKAVNYMGFIKENGKLFEDFVLKTSFVT